MKLINKTSLEFSQNKTKLSSLKHHWMVIWEKKRLFQHHLKNYHFLIIYYSIIVWDTSFIFTIFLIIYYFSAKMLKGQGTPHNKTTLIWDPKVCRKKYLRHTFDTQSIWHLSLVDSPVVDIKNAKFSESS